ncbi:unnamed protein product [Discosporangium mesarthrocarpum]
MRRIAVVPCLGTAFRGRMPLLRRGESGDLPLWLKQGHREGAAGALAKRLQKDGPRGNCRPWRVKRGAGGGQLSRGSRGCAGTIQRGWSVHYTCASREDTEQAIKCEQAIVLAT